MLYNPQPGGEGLAVRLQIEVMNFGFPTCSICNKRGDTIECLQLLMTRKAVFVCALCGCMYVCTLMYVHKFVAF